MLLTLITGILGGFVGRKLRLPAGYLMGSLLSVAILNSFFYDSAMPSITTLAVQISAGGVLGANINKNDITELKSIIFPSLMLIACMIILNMLIGFAIFSFSSLDLATSLLASAPGGVTEMSLIAVNLGGNAALVAVIQLIRFISVMSISPFVLGKICNKKLSSNDFIKDDKKCEGLVEDKENEYSKKERIAITLTVSIVFGLIGSILPIPAGALTFSMLAVALINIVKKMGRVFKHQRLICQILAGTLIGSSFSFSGFLLKKDFLIAILVLIVGVTVINIFIGILINKVSKIDFPTALFASAPGGMSDMALISKEFGADQTKVVIMQLVRLISVIVLFPSIIKFVYTLLSV
ncbi:AbrB family transcriptional regulator [Herbivorax sp. ANBcel31]|uniref:AbrB family transcriptional regulator n=1 Tax=Herbivorax sp. ANBcel31 TaxID=3069754 RepID=UPI0027AED115|nr:AbrB family transcriptional regulator [Herbivorax sp. ANBcel31]MDQ2086744.1 AbrB family transcriptional regulator [Herbivorax sp. ANBcel31]